MAEFKIYSGITILECFEEARKRMKKISSLPINEESPEFKAILFEVIQEISVFLKCE